MKALIRSLLTLLATATAAFAAPKLLIQTKLTGPNDLGGTEVLMPPAFTLESGKTGTVAMSGLIEYAVTSTVFPNGTVHLDLQLLSENNKRRCVRSPRIETQLGYSPSIVLGQRLFTTKVTLVSK